MALKLVPRPPDEQTLAGIRLFQNVPRDVVSELSRHCKCQYYQSRQTIIQYQDQDRRVFFVVRGRVRTVYQSPCGREVTLRDLSEGDTFGDLSAIDGHSRSASVIAVADTLVASMTDILFWQA